MIRFSLNETSRVRDVTMTLIDDVIENNNTAQQAVSQVLGGLYSLVSVNDEVSLLIILFYGSGLTLSSSVSKLALFQLPFFRRCFFCES